MARLRWGVKTAPQHTTYDAMLKVWQEADRTPAFEHAWLFDHFAPIQGDLDGPCFEGWTLLAALGGPDLAPAPRLDGRRQHLPPPRGPCPHGGHGRRDLQRPPRFRRRRRLERVRAPEHGHPALRARRAHPAPRRGLRDHQAALHPAAHRLRRALLPAQAGALRAEADPEAVPAVRHRRQWRAAHPARRGALRRRLELHAAPTWRPSGTRCASCTSTAPPSAAIPSEIELSVQTRVNYDDLAGDGRDAPAARRGRRHAPRS